MTDNIVHFPRGAPDHECRLAENVIDDASQHKLDRVFLIGFCPEDEKGIARMYCDVSCNFTAAALLLALEQFKAQLIHDLTYGDDHG